MNSSDVWYTEEKDENGETVGLLNFSDAFIEKLGWNIGDTIDFSVEDNKIVLKKV